MESSVIFYAILSTIIIIFGFAALMGRTPRCKKCKVDMKKCDDYGHWKCDCGEEKHI